MICLSAKVVDEVQVRATLEFARQEAQQSGERLQLVAATVTSIRPVGMGDRCFSVQLLTCMLLESMHMRPDQKS